MSAEQVHERTALDLACAIRDREVSSTELAEEFLQRIRRLDPSTGAFVRTFERRARRAAAAADRALAAPDAVVKGTFFGVPTAIKDIEPVRFSRYQMGSRAYRYFWLPIDGPFVKRYRDAGFVFLGATGTSEFAAMPYVETDIHPPCRNPWSPDHTPGGSSGGAAAAVAAGLVPVAHATDGGGSIRIPASHSHLVGLKPSRGGHHDLLGERNALGMIGINAVSLDVDDTAAVLDVLQGTNYDPRRPPTDSVLSRSRSAPERLRIRFTTETPITTVDSHIVEGVQRVARSLEALGHHVEEGPMFAVDPEAALPIWYWLIAQNRILSEDHVQPATRWLREQGRDVDRSEVFARAAELAAQVTTWFGEVDLWLTPTVPHRPAEVGSWLERSGEEAFRDIIPTGSFVTQFNVSGHPAISVPAGVSDDGLPFGAQLVARHDADVILLQVARQLQDVLAWRERPRPTRSLRS